MTLIVNGTCASELRTRFWPIRLTYSVTTGSFTSLICDSICWAYTRPRATWPSTVYQFPTPRPHPTFRLPTASTSVLPPPCLIWLSSAVGGVAGPCLGPFCPSPHFG